ncbi:4Fe-4S binding protein [Tumidithrix elongata RA019]|uniref:4Fe-4S binding protein n=1 Tax=Tumidithrix elongata BACA0141 TaxID=2716417 RepID=A0AAW9Q7D0_9CYAN|nr:4Fe-4S binding protein [Tumidithrix elongata RA019]
MIELISHKLCISCNVCVQVCPTNVFDAVPNQPPAIARQEDCQTCFMCEAYCPADALYVAPESHTKVAVNEEALIERGIMGEYRRTLGWGYGRKNNSELDAAHRLRLLPRPYQST